MKNLTSLNPCRWPHRAVVTQSVGRVGATAGRSILCWSSRSSPSDQNPLRTAPSKICAGTFKGKAKALGAVAFELARSADEDSETHRPFPPTNQVQMFSPEQQQSHVWRCFVHSAEVYRHGRAEMRCRPGWSGRGAPSLFSKGSCKIIK